LALPLPLKILFHSFSPDFLPPSDTFSISTAISSIDPSDSASDSSIPPKDYGSSAYWDTRYENHPTPFDWYQDWSDLHTILKDFFNPTQLVLNIGCGNSRMSTEMSESFKLVINIDISSVVIRQMEASTPNQEKLRWFTMDCTDMTFEDGIFDLVFDKGTLDALFCGDEAMEKVEQTLEEVYRVLRPNGLFFEITYGKPEFRFPIFRGNGRNWEIRDPMIVQDQERNMVHYVYVFQKGVEGGDQKGKRGEGD
jgi:SAM-dependent methyltransferase